MLRGIDKFGTGVTVESSVISGMRAQVSNKLRGCTQEKPACPITYVIFEDAREGSNQAFPFRRVSVVFQDTELAAKHPPASVLRPSQLEGKPVVMGQFVHRNNQWLRIVSGPALRQ